MPLYSCTSILPTGFYSLWQIEESVEYLQQQLPLPLQADLLKLSIRSSERMRQSLAARLALLYLLKKIQLPIIDLLRTEEGQPYFLNYPTLHVSFSHTRHLAAAALSMHAPIGIDVEIIRKQIVDVQKKTCSQQELIDIGCCLKKATIYWSAKEALYKSLPHRKSIIFKDILVRPFEVDVQGKIIAQLKQQKYNLDYTSILGDLQLLPHYIVYTTM